MPVVHYAINVIPTEHKQALNRLFAMIVGDDILESTNLSVPANATSDHEDPFTHWYGGLYVDAQWLDIFQNLTTNLPEPDGGWPLMVEGNPVLTEQEAIDAAAALIITVRTGENDPQLPPQTLTAALNALGLKMIEWPDD